MQKEKIASLRARLEQELGSIEQHLRDLGANVEGERVDLSTDGGFADSAAATAERSETLSLVEGLAASHQDVLDALRKMDEGTYGRCENCNKEIAQERLEAIPSARLCVACKQKAGQG
jgi:DnaK suppressor protein